VGVSTAASSADESIDGSGRGRTAPSWGRRRHDIEHAFTDLAALLAFRASTLRGRQRLGATVGAGVVLGLTIAAGWLAAYLPEGGGPHGVDRTDVLVLVPSLMTALLLTSVLAASSAGGGRELLPRQQAAAFPVGATTDHLGALLLAPLNITWLLQCWLLLSSVAYVVRAGPGLLLAQLVVLVWVAAATAIGQVVGWWLEWLRRGAHGEWAVRALWLVLLLAAALVLVAGRLVPLLEASPTVEVTAAALAAATSGPSVTWLRTLSLLLVVLLVAVVAGAALAAAVDRRQPRDELREESRTRRPRTIAASDLTALLRTDRASVWRSVPLRRGLLLLAVGPGAVAAVGALPWAVLTTLPGLVASGGALLFGVNAWCLDGPGGVWRDSLPVPPRLAFTARAWVTAEVLALATVATVALAALRAGPASPGEVVAVGCSSVVVIAQVVAASLRWSLHRPYAVDLRSARAAPAPPLAMVGYSVRLAFATTLVGLVFSALSAVAPDWSLLVAVPFLLVSAARLVATSRRWEEPPTRSRVLATVAG
jgi:hypothetical protein